MPSQLREIADRARPVALARELTLPVHPVLQSLLPGGALQRGTSVGVGGEAASSLALALTAAASQAGSWVAVVGVPELGLVAAVELGVALERLVVVEAPPAPSWGTVVAALVGAFDVILVGPAPRMGRADARRLAARSRERGSVLVQVGTEAGSSTLELDVRLDAGRVRWVGLGDGHGHLRARQVRVEATGRRRAARPRQVDLWLPAADGTISIAGPHRDHQRPLHRHLQFAGEGFAAGEAEMVEAG